MDTVLAPTEIAMRLTAAAASGITLGINRDLKGKPTGMRTLGLVALGAALATVGAVYLAPFQNDPNAQSRVVQGVMQGVLTGIAFLGAGAIIRHDGAQGAPTQGLTTAANVFVVAAIGIVCGLGEWWAALLGWTLALVILVILSPIENRLEKLARREAKRLAEIEAGEHRRPPEGRPPGG